MTDREFEQLLAQKAAEVPLPSKEMAFLKRGERKRRAHLRAALVLLAAVIAVSATVAAYNRTARGLRITPLGATLDKTHYRVGGERFLLPEAFGDLAYEGDRVYSLVAHDASFWQALFTPAYRYVSVDYGGQLSLTVSVGAAEGACWQQVFSYRDGEPDEALWADSGMGRAGVEVYSGCQLVSFAGESRSTVTWADRELGLCFSVTVWHTTGDLELALACAREIIDGNR